MVHQDFHTLFVCIVVQHLDVEIGIRRLEVEYISLPHVRPVFPSYIPSFYEHFVEPVLGCKVDVTLYLLIVGCVASVRPYCFPIDVVEFDAGEFVGLVPRTLTYNHFPPYTAVFCRMNPRNVFECTRLVEVEDEV